MRLINGDALIRQIKEYIAPEGDEHSYIEVEEVIEMINSLPEIIPSLF